MLLGSWYFKLGCFRKRWQLFPASVKVCVHALNLWKCVWLQILAGVNAASAHFRLLMWYYMQLTRVRLGCDGKKTLRSEESEAEQSHLDNVMKVHIPLNPTGSRSDTAMVTKTLTQADYIEIMLHYTLARPSMWVSSHQHAGSPSDKRCLHFHIFKPYAHQKMQRNLLLSGFRTEAELWKGSITQLSRRKAACLQWNTESWSFLMC